MSNASGGATYTPNGLTFSGTTVLSNSSGFNSTVGANLFVVWSSTTATTRQRFIAIQYNSGLIGAYFDTTYIDIHYNLSTGYYYGPIAYSTGTSYIYTATTGTGPLLSYSINGTNSTSWTAPETGNAYSSTGNAIGGQGGLTFNGNIMEVVYFDAFMTTPQRQAIEGYLAQKWGLTSQLPPGHPGRSQTYYNGRVYQPQISLKPAPYANYFPLSIGACTVWLDAMDPAGTSVIPGNGTSITTWVDKSGNGYNFTNGSRASPTYSTNALTFTGSGTNTANTQILSNTSVPLSLTYSIFAVALQNSSHPSYTGYNYILTANTTTNQYLNVGTATSGYFATFTGYTYPTTAFNDTSPNTPNTTVLVQTLVSLTNDNTTLRPYLNGSNMGTKVGTTNAVTGLTVGDAPTLTYSGQNWNGNISEIIVYNQELTTNQRQQVEGYLAWKWGLQSSLINTHPYYSAPPLQYTRGAILGAPTLTATGSASYANTAYYNVSPQAWNYNWQPYLQSLVAANSSGVTATFSNTAVSGTYTIGTTVYAPNGYLYTMSQSGGSFTVINTVNNGIVTTISNPNSYRYSGGILAPNGLIYCIPLDGATSPFGYITPSNNSFTSFGSGYTGYPNGVLGPNGLIYCMPFSAVSFLYLNPTNNQITTFGPSTGGYYGGVLAPNGNIYCISYSAGSIGLIITSTNEFSTFGSSINGYTGGVLAPNGLIFCIPLAAVQFGYINPANNSFTVFGPSTGGYHSGSLGPDGNIYCCSWSAGNVAVINPNNFVVSTLSGSSGNGYFGTITTPYGIYLTPQLSGPICTITFSGLKQIPSANYCLSAWANKF